MKQYQPGTDADLNIQAIFRILNQIEVELVQLTLAINAINNQTRANSGQAGSIPIVTKVPVAEDAVMKQYILESEMDRVRVVFPDDTDKGVYQPFSLI
jgi:hypothetical protein